MNILLLGKTGQVAQSFLSMKKSKTQILAFDREEMPLDDRHKLSNNLSNVLRNNSIDFLINAAAFTDVNEAEVNSQLAFEINSNALLTITREIKKNSKKKTTLIHFSTDYIFDGTGNKPWYPHSKPNPLNVYGKSKLKGEEAIIHSNIPALILRTSWVFSKNGTNFLKTVLNKLKKNETLKIVDDQSGSPTSSDFISKFCWHVLENSLEYKKFGIYHLTGKGVTTWYKFAKFIAKTAHEKGVFDVDISNNILPVKSSDYSSKVIRPKNSYLDCQSLEKDFSFPRTTWQEQTSKILDQIISETK